MSETAEYLQGSEVEHGRVFSASLVHPDLHDVVVDMWEFALDSYVELHTINYNTKILTELNW